MMYSSQKEGRENGHWRLFEQPVYAKPAQQASLRHTTDSLLCVTCCWITADLRIVALGSWADEMDSQPIPSVPAYSSRDGFGGERRAFTQPSWERSDQSAPGMDRGASYGTITTVASMNI